jgi:hypothetical protein
VGTNSLTVGETLRNSNGLPLEDSSSDLSRVFHRLNNQLGVILANAELLEARLADATERARAGQVVGGALEAIAAVQDLRRLVGVAGTLPR